MKIVKKTAAWLLCLCLLVGMPFSVGAANGPLTLVSAEVVDDTKIVFNFSEAVKLPDSEVTAGIAVRYDRCTTTDDFILDVSYKWDAANQKPTWVRPWPDSADTSDVTANWNLTDLSYYEGDHTKIVGTIADGFQYSYIEAIQKHISDFADQREANGGTAEWEISDYVINAYIGDGDATKAIEAIKAEGSDKTLTAAVMTNKDRVYAVPTKAKAPLTLVSTEVVDDTKIVFNFSEAVNLPSGDFSAGIAVRYDRCTTTDDFILDVFYTWDATNQKPTLVRPWPHTGAVTANWNLTDLAYYEGDHTKIVGTIADGFKYSYIEAIQKQISDLADQREANGGTAEWEISDYVINAYIGDDGATKVIEAIKAEGSDKSLTAAVMTNKDRVYAVPTKTQKALTLVSVSAVNDTQIVFNFSEAVNLPSGNYSAGICVRRDRVADAKDFIQDVFYEWDSAANKPTKAFPWNATHRAVWNLTDLTYYEGDQTKIVGTVEKGFKISDIQAICNLVAEYCAGKAEAAGVQADAWMTDDYVIDVYFHDTDATGQIEAVTAKGSDHKLTAPVLSGKDWAFAQLKLPEKATFSLVSVDVVGESQLVFNFSEEVNLPTGNYSAGICVRRDRVADSKDFIQDVFYEWDEAKDQPIKAFPWDATHRAVWKVTDLAYYEGDHTRIVGTIENGYTYIDITNVWSLVADYCAGKAKEAGSAAHEWMTDDYVINAYFNDNDATKAIETMTAEHSDAVLKASILSGKDYTYAEPKWVPDMDPDKAVYIEKTEVLDQTRIVITFSEDMVLAGAVGYIRLINDQYQVVRDDNGVALEWGGRLEYYGDSRSRFVFVLDHNHSNPDYPMTGLDEIFNAGLEKNGTWLMFCIGDSRGNDGVITSFSSVRGGFMQAYPGNSGSDVVYLSIDPDEIPQGDLTITDTKVVADNAVIITFSAPVDIVDSPFIAPRWYASNGKLIWKTKDGQYVHASSYNGEPTTPMQWWMRWEWHNEEHTQIRCWTASGMEGFANFNDILYFDWNAELEGSYLAIGIEECNATAVNGNWHVENVKLLSDPRITLRATLTTGMNYDGAYADYTVDYTPKTLTASASIVNDMQIRVRFSEKVKITGKIFMALRYLNENGGVMYYGNEYTRHPLQFGGSWKWEEEGRSLIWTMSGHNTLGCFNITDVVNYNNGAVVVKGAPLAFCIEEMTTAGTITVGGKNLLVDNISTLDGQNHLRATLLGGYDGRYMDFGAQRLKGAVAPKLLSARAIDDQTVEIAFSQPVILSEDIAMSIQYMDEKGEVQFMADGRTANFKGTWKYKDESQTAILWTLNSKHVDNLTQIFNYEKTLMWNAGARVCFVIKNTKDSVPINTMRMLGITTKDGLQHLEIPILSDVQIKMDIEIAYDKPAIPVDAQEPETVLEYVSNYVPFIVGGIGISLAGVIAAIVLIFARKKEGNNEK